MFKIIGFIILPITSLLVFGYAFDGNIKTNGYSWLFFFQLILLIGLLYGINQERKKEIDKKLSINSALDYNNFLAVFAGAFVAFTFNNYLGMGSVVAAGLVGTIAAIMIPKFGVPLYCGAFVGMASCVLFTSYLYLAIASIVAGIVFVLTKNVFNGFGGKLGTIALTGCILASVFSGKKYLASGPIPTWETSKYIVLFSVIAAVLTYLISIRLKHGAVFGSGVVGLLAGLIMPYLFPEIGSSLAVMMICASFAGMSTPTRIPNEIFVAISGLLSAFFFIYSTSCFGGTGGKLGTIAFISVIIIRGFLDMIDYFKSKKG